ncbi:baseplate J/gp47 family protein [Gluconobacter oxydans]|uniref:baseplate J/gp47 family protein n=1 Tax=Gluconobacter oxydans TaxID=442 RepID=UPI00046608A6|nr:baseplate J/gp47 family protein [Gluconobacter oxydans]
MALSLRSFAQITSGAVTAAQAASTTLLDLSTGTAGLAILESVSGVGLWLQYVALQILTRNRLSTSQGTDVDSFIADFGFSRSAGNAATGTVTFTSFTPSLTSATIVPGVTVRTVAGITYDVTEDSANTAWDATAGGYVRQAGVSSITVPVTCETSGTAGNVGIGAICLLGTAISGIDTVTNAAALTNGSDAQTDAEVRADFPSWIASLGRGTLAAIIAAVERIGTDIQCDGIENYDSAGDWDPGNITIYVDDGSGDVSDTILTEAYTIADQYRASPVSIQVVRPTVVRPAVAMVLTLTSGASASTVEGAVTADISSYFNGLAIGDGAVYTQIIQIIYAASTSISSVSGVTLNGGTSDITGVAGVAIRAGAVTYG